MDGGEAKGVKNEQEQFPRGKNRHKNEQSSSKRF